MGHCNINEIKKTGVLKSNLTKLVKSKQLQMHDIKIEVVIKHIQLTN